MNPFKVREHLFFTTVAHAPLFAFAAMEGDHQVVLFAAAQRIMHQMTMRPGPQYRRVNTQVFRHVGGLDHRAVHHVAGDPRRIAEQTLAHH